ncbi:Z1 domain-containing protein [Micromonospora psammae]|uniref:Z1 domain-containing protein n=1 Tax=Micromonospora sp. CPCC 205556 TaxID=3122398 RepID=UPI002FEEC367
MPAEPGVIDALDRVVTAELTSLPADQLTPQLIRTTIDDFRQLPRFASISDGDAEQLARLLETRHAVILTIGNIVKVKHEPWLPDAKAEIDPYYWQRYRKLLASKGMGVPVLATLDEVSDRTLGLLGNPREAGVWARKGLVLGNVQSGKTANYLGLICKASDAGYRVIIVIAGIHNNLRNQTQSRVDEGFIGFEKGAGKNKLGKVVGVGRIDLQRRPSHFTSSTRDFSQAAASQVGVPLQNLNEPAVFVIKKNANTLANLTQWLKTSLQGGRINSPLLLIDDEADNASINVSQNTNAASTINAQIRELLAMFERSSYVGYTATPFANIFIDPESDDEMLGQDLFPRDFIVSLDPPSNYLGARRVFLESPDEFLRPINDSDDAIPIKHRITQIIEGLPDSLRFAVRAFLLVRAIRILRGEASAHNSMLINASRFTRVQSQLRNHVHSYLEELQNALRISGALDPVEARAVPEIFELENTWKSEYGEAGQRWEDVLSVLHDAAAPIRVVEVNNKSAGKLNYSDFENGLNVIAVGGFSLSRGLTLEGLSITYFLRSSVMYDTLMQMGRWFGYRPGYEDLCRIWMPEDAQGWYAHIAESIEMLRDDLKDMEAAGATPEDFGLRVRSHPDSLIVTARNKMGTGKRFVVSIGLGGSQIETTPVSARDSDYNVRRTRSLVTAVQASGVTPIPLGGSWLFSGVSPELVASFVRDYKQDPGSTKTQSGPVVAYIEGRAASTLSSWDVLLVGRQPTAKEPLVERTDYEALNDLRVVYQVRSTGSRSRENTLYIGDNQKVASRGIERAGMSDAQREAAEEQYRRDNPSPDGDPVNYPDVAYRRFRAKPLLMLHLVRLKTSGNGGGPNLPPLVAAWGISFPPSPLGQSEKRVEFVVNTVWFREHFGVDSDDELEGED